MTTVCEHIEKLGKERSTETSPFGDEVLSVPGGTFLGPLPEPLLKLQVQKLEAAKRVAELERQLKAAKKVAEGLDALFEAGVMEIYPAKLSVTPNAVGMVIAADTGRYFGPDGVYEAPTANLQQAVAHFEKERRARSRNGSFDPLDDEDSAMFAHFLREAAGMN